MNNAFGEKVRILKLNLERREILEALVRQGVRLLSQLKRECRLYEEYQEARVYGYAQHEKSVWK
jgi:predicted nuclease with TOPRIM domain